MWYISLTGLNAISGVTFVNGSNFIAATGTSPTYDKSGNVSSYYSLYVLVINNANPEYLAIGFPDYRTWQLAAVQDTSNKIISPNDDNAIYCDGGEVVGHNGRIGSFPLRSNEHCVPVPKNIKEMQ